MTKSISMSRFAFFLPLAGALLLGTAGPALAQPPAWPTEIPPAKPQPAAAAAMQGVWKITTPTNTLKPVSGSVPFTAEGRKAYDVNKKLKAQRKFDDYDITTSRCSTPGVPRLMLMPMRFHLLNQQNVVTFDFEWNRAIRQIDLRGIVKEKSLVPNQVGVTSGSWDGDTLVAITTDGSDRTLIDDLVPRTADTKVTEHFRLIDENTLEDRITIEDATYFTQPWEAVLTFKRQPTELFAEDVCLDRLDAQRAGKKKTS